MRQVTSSLKAVLDYLKLITLLSLCLCSHASVCFGGAEKSSRAAATHASDERSSRQKSREAPEGAEESAVKLHLNAGEKEEAARNLNRLGRRQLSQNSPRDAIASYQRALTLIGKDTSSASFSETEVDSLNGLGMAYVFLQKKAEAEEVLHRALAISSRVDYTFGQAQALLTLSGRQNLDNHATALATAQRALLLWGKLGDKVGLGRTYSQIGICYMAQNMLPEATWNYQQALQIWQELNDISERAGALIMLGFIKYREAEWQNSISLLTEAQNLIDEEKEPEMMGQIAAGLAAAFNENGLPQNGLVHFQRALSFYRRTQNPQLIAYATWGVGSTYYQLGQYSQALSYFQQALRGVDGSGLDAALNHEYIGRVGVATDDYASALTHLRLALGIYTQAINPLEAARVRALMGEVYDRQGNAARARRNYRQALAGFERLGDRINQAAVYFAMGRMELSGGYYAAAENFLRRSIDVTESVRRITTSSDLIVAFSASTHERYEKYIDCLMRMHQAEPSRGFDVQAFEQSELARARSLVEFLNATRTHRAPGVDPQLAEREKSLRQSLRAKEDQRISLLGQHYRKAELQALDAEITAAETEYGKVYEAVKSQDPSYERAARPAAWNLQKIQKQIIVDDQTVLLEYVLGSEKSYVWVVTREGFASYEIGPREQITEHAKRLYEQLSSLPTESTDVQVSRAVDELNNLVLSPVRAHLNNRKVIVAADGALDFIPFQLLLRRWAEREKIANEFEVSGVPSASILGQLREEAERRRSGGRPKLLAAFGDPVYASNYAQSKGEGSFVQTASEASPESKPHPPSWRDIDLGGDSFDPTLVQPLFYAKLELANLRGVTAPEATYLAANFDASRTQLLNTDLTQFAILHIATHGYLDPVRPENSGLMLSTVDRRGRPQNGFVNLRDIYSLRAPVDLVVLSACRTAVGKELRGEGLIGLSRGFMHAGASSVVASLWKVDDEATAELMKQFYQNMLEKGMTTSAALRAAQDTIRRKPGWQSPYYWAGFSLQGEHHQIIRPGRREGETPEIFKLGVGASLITLLLSGVLLRRHHISRRRTKRP